ncbi:MAG TPA: hypothetical protein VJJ98_05775 [Sedimentisphaerales bacterium]|nr:hypothetical protein [Sedimentisphaerales bacterium]
MDGANEEHNDNRPEVARQFTAPSVQAPPPYDFYEQGVNRVGWRTGILAAIEKGYGGHVVAVVAILTLGEIACELVKNQADRVDLMTLIGCLAVAAMVSVIGLLGMFWARKERHAENTEEDESQTTEPGVGSQGSNENGTAPR